MAYTCETPKSLEDLIGGRCDKKFEDITVLYLCMLKPLATCQLTELEKNGGVEGPNLAPLVNEWRSAVRLLPEEHHVKEIHFDMFCEQTMEIREIVRLLQLISTVVRVKAKDDIKCFVERCNEERRVWLEGSIVGVSA